MLCDMNKDSVLMTCINMFLLCRSKNNRVLHTRKYKTPDMSRNHVLHQLHILYNNSKSTRANLLRSGISQEESPSPHHHHHHHHQHFRRSSNNLLNTQTPRYYSFSAHSSVTSISPLS